MTSAPQGVSRRPRRRSLAGIAPALIVEALTARVLSRRHGAWRPTAGTQVLHQAPAAPLFATATRPAAARSAATPPRSAAPALLRAQLPSDAGALAQQAFDQAFYAESAGLGYYCEHATARRLTGFWQAAELIEMAVDGVIADPRPAARRRLVALIRGFALRYGCHWTAVREYNDDVLWMVIAALRVNRLTGNRACLAAARDNFALTLDRGHSSHLGGGVWWTTKCESKHACSTAPAVLAAAGLYEATGEAPYLDLAEELFAWLRAQLFDAQTGRVSDNLRAESGAAGVRVDNQPYTYNQGTFIGAADALARLTGNSAYVADAAAALGFTRDVMSDADGILPAEGRGGDGGGFKGIFARHAAAFVRRHQLRDDEEWLLKNARRAWECRDAAGLIDEDWRTGAAPDSPAPYAWDASSAVTLLHALSAPPSR